MTTYWIGDTSFVRCFCGEAVRQGDATAGGADSEYSRGAAGTFDYPMTVECENCKQHWCDGDPVDDPCPFRRRQ